jgi:major membrane immunogen (membrane-anchored lipoprotein)
MKKIFLFVSAVMLVSCSSDDENNIAIPDKVDGTLLKKAVYTNSSGQISTAEYTYDGNKLLKVEANSGSSTSYTYTGNKITRINYNFGSLNTESQFLTYNSDGKLESIKKTVLGDITYSVTYTDNDDDTVTIKDYNGDFAVGAPLVSESKAFIGADGSVTKIEKYGGSSTLVYDYTYDAQFTPTADIIGYDKLRFYQTGSTANPHNVLAVSGSGSVEMHYTYNAQGYASTVQEDEDGPTVKYYYY